MRLPPETVQSAQTESLKLLSQTFRECCPDLGMVPQVHRYHQCTAGELVVNLDWNWRYGRAEMCRACGACDWDLRNTQD